MPTRLVSLSTFSLPWPSSASSLKSALMRRRLRLSQRADDPLFDLVADIALALECHHVGEAGTWRNLDEREGLAGVHAAAKLVTGGPELGVKAGLFDRCAWFRGPAYAVRSPTAPSLGCTLW